MIVDSISVHKHTKKGLGRNPANVISQLVNNPHNIPVIYFFLCPGLSVSAILEGQNYNQYLGKLLSFLDPVLQSPGRGRFVRCWHAKTDGSAASIFHSNCDGKGPTVTIIKYGSYIFGGYTDVSWHSKYHFQNYRHHSLSLKRGSASADIWCFNEYDLKLAIKVFFWRFHSVLVPYVGWVCCWSSPCSEAFSQVLRFSSPHNKPVPNVCSSYWTARVPNSSSWLCMVRYGNMVS